MDNPVQDYEFLDLSGLGEDDLSHLRSVLGANPEQQGLTLPWAEDEVSLAEPPLLEPEHVESDDVYTWIPSQDHPDIQFGEPINGGHLELAPDVDLTSGDEASQTQPLEMMQSVAPTSSHSEMLHSPYGQPHEDPHAVYPAVQTYVSSAPMYQHSMAPFQPVTTYQMMDAPLQHPRDQRQRRKPNNKRDMMHAHSQDMMPRGLVPSYEPYPPYAQYPYAQHYQQYQPIHNVHPAHAGSPIFMYHHHPSMYEFHPPHPPMGVPPPPGPKMSFSQAPPVSVPTPAPVPATPASLSGPPLLPPPPIIPAVVPPPVIPALPPVVPEAAPVPAPAPVPIIAPPLAPAPQPTTSPARAPPPAPVKDVKSPPSAPVAQAPVLTPGPPAGAVLTDRKPSPKADVAPAEECRRPSNTPVSAPPPVAKEAVPAPATAPAPAQPQPQPQQKQPPSENSVTPLEVPPPALSPTPSSLPAPAPVTQPSKSPSPEPPATTVPAPTVKIEDNHGASVPQSTSQWGKASFASLFNNKSQSAGSAPVSGYSPAAVPHANAFNSQRSDGPQAVSPPTQSGWGPMQPPSKSNHISQQSRSYLPPGAVPSGIAPPLPPPNPSHDPKLHQLSEFLHRYKLDHKPASLQPRGLTNRNNWCYINATLQALLACPPFYNLFYNLPDLPTSRSSESRAAVMESMKMFVKEFQHLPASAKLKRADRAARSKEGEGVQYDIQTGTPFEPTFVYRMLSVIQTDSMVEGRQEDAEEFLSCLLNSLNDEMLDLMKVMDLPNGDVSATTSPIPSPSNGETESFSPDEADEWKVMGPKNKGAVTRRADFGRTPLSDIFRGHVRSRVFRSGQAVDHSYTDNVQPFFTLQLDIENSTSVKEALEAYVKRDMLEGLTCSRSNQEVTAWQEVQLEELPPVLLLHLKWFDYSHEGCSKILKTIRYDIELKVDSKLLSSSKKQKASSQQYKLFAVVYHDGKEATKGHYITDAYHAGYNQWIRYDDSSVRVIPAPQVLSPRPPRVPYLLYYRRHDTVTVDRH